ncbi:MAG: hypothetical protein ABIE84_00845 [bacterium]
MSTKTVDCRAITTSGLRTNNDLLARANQRLRQHFSRLTEGVKPFICDDRTTIIGLPSSGQIVLALQLNYIAGSFDCSTGAVLARRILEEEFGIQSDVYTGVIKIKGGKSDIGHQLLRLRNPGALLALVRQSATDSGYFYVAGSDVYVDVTSLRGLRLFQAKPLGATYTSALEAGVFAGESIMVVIEGAGLTLRSRTLTDGSVFSINVGSQATYRQLLNQSDWQVYLEGEVIRAGQGQNRATKHARLRMVIPLTKVNAAKRDLLHRRHDPAAVLAYLREHGFCRGDLRKLGPQLSAEVEQEADVFYHLIAKFTVIDRK